MKKRLGRVMSASFADYCFALKERYLFLFIKLALFRFTTVAQSCLSPLMRRARAMSLGMRVTRFAWMAHRLASSNKFVMKASAASWRARIDWLWKRMSGLPECAISRTSLWKGNLGRVSSELLYILRISRSTTVPGLARLLTMVLPDYLSFLEDCGMTMRWIVCGAGGA